MCNRRKLNLRKCRRGDPCRPPPPCVSGCWPWHSCLEAPSPPPSMLCLRAWRRGRRQGQRHSCQKLGRPPWRASRAGGWPPPSVPVFHAALPPPRRCCGRASRKKGQHNSATKHGCRIDDVRCWRCRSNHRRQKYAGLVGGIDSIQGKFFVYSWMIYHNITLLCTAT